MTVTAERPSPERPSPRTRSFRTRSPRALRTRKPLAVLLPALGPGLVLALIVAACSEPVSLADAEPAGPSQTVRGEWPQYRGPDRDGISDETSLLTSWPEGGPAVQWKAEGGGGYSALVVSDGRLLTQVSRGGDELLVAWDAATGEELWTLRLDATYRNRFGDGPRSTPTVDGAVVYALGARGKLVAAKAASGEKLWGRDLVAEMGAQIPQWGISMAPLVHGGHLLLDVGGTNGRSMAALDKATGATVWTVGDDGAGYSAPIAFSAAGREQIVFFTAKKLSGVSPGGEILWSHPWKTSYDVNAAAPIFVPPSRLFVSSGYDTGSGLFEIVSTDGGVDVREVWTARNLKNQFSSSVIVGEHIYGFDNKVLKAVSLASGEDAWRQRAEGHGSLLYADGHLYVLGERGTLSLVEATPEAYREKASVQVLEGKCWTMPTLVDGNLFVRNEEVVLSLRVGPAST